MKTISKLSAVGLSCVLMFTLGIYFGWWRAQPSTQDAADIKHLYTELRHRLREGKLAEATQLFTPPTSIGALTNTFSFLLDPGYELSPNAWISVSGDRGEIYPGDSKSLSWHGVGLDVRHVEGRWFFTGECRTYND